MEPAAPAETDQKDALAEQVRAAVEPLLSAYGDAAVVVGVVSPEGPRFFGFGRVSDEFRVTPDEHTRFEIGSVTKVVIGLLLADMAERGEVLLDDAVQTYLPPELVVPGFVNRPITLLDLATHSSGLSELPWDMPYRRRERGEKVGEEETIGHPSGTQYTRERLAKALRKEALSQAPGSEYAYSSLGFGLLGIALSERAKTPLGPLLHERIFTPLGMHETHLYPEDARFDQRFAQGQNEAGRQTWFRSDEEALAACCGLRSSAFDLAKLVQVQLDNSEALAKAARWTQYPVRRSGWQGGYTYLERMGLGWHVMSRPRGRLYKFGRMSGYATLIDVDPAATRGVIVLAAHHTFPVAMVSDALLPRPVAEHDAHTRVLEAENAIQQPAIAQWEAGISLLGVAASHTKPSAGERVEVRLRFRAERPIARALTLSVHADGRAGRTLINHRPSLSTQAWPVGHVVEHVLSFVVPSDYPSTDAQLWFGWYDASGIVKLNDGAERVKGPAIEVLATAGADHRVGP
jgi:CubicO group peptidase (beta-lactamase class C family)